MLIRFPSVVQVVKNLPAKAGDVDSISGYGRSPGEGNGNALQYSCLENPRGQRSLVGFSLWGHKRVRHDLATKQRWSLGAFFKMRKI